MKQIQTKRFLTSLILVFCALFSANALASEPEYCEAEDCYMEDYAHYADEEHDCSEHLLEEEAIEYEFQPDYDPDYH